MRTTVEVLRTLCGIYGAESIAPMLRRYADLRRVTADQLVSWAFGDDRLNSVSEAALKRAFPRIVPRLRKEQG